ncbi:hypothetical protein KOAAANKH_01897 [Brevundimonas sp. NIBR10]|nr:hypothetical protein KOAAANKH_01897 [Brevundimonas sp. NIBR10]
MFCKPATPYLPMSFDRQLVEGNGACAEGV